MCLTRSSSAGKEADEGVGLGILSPLPWGGEPSGGRCFTFDKSANGYARGEGAGAAALRLLPDAGDFARAVLRGVSVNQDTSNTAFRAHRACAAGPTSNTLHGDRRSPPPLGPNLVEVRPTLVELGSESAESGPSLVVLAEHLGAAAGVSPVSANSAQARPDLRDIFERVSKHRSGYIPSCSCRCMLGSFWTTRPPAIVLVALAASRQAGSRPLDNPARWAAP